MNDGPDMDLLSAIFGAGSTTSLLITQHCSRSLIVAFLPRQISSDCNIEQGGRSQKMVLDPFVGWVETKRARSCALCRNPSLCRCAR